MNDIVGIHVCPVCQTIVLEADDRQAEGFELNCPVCFDEDGNDPEMEDLTDALLDDQQVATCVSNLLVSLQNYIKAGREKNV